MSVGGVGGGGGGEKGVRGWERLGGREWEGGGCGGINRGNWGMVGGGKGYVCVKRIYETIVLTHFFRFREVIALSKAEEETLKHYFCNILVFCFQQHLLV